MEHSNPEGLDLSAESVAYIFIFIIQSVLH